MGEWEGNRAWERLGGGRSVLGALLPRLTSQQVTLRSLSCWNTHSLQLPGRLSPEKLGLCVPLRSVVFPSTVLCVAGCNSSETEVFLLTGAYSSLLYFIYPHDSSLEEPFSVFWVLLKVFGYPCLSRFSFFFFPIWVYNDHHIHRLSRFSHAVRRIAWGHWVVAAARWLTPTSSHAEPKLAALLYADGRIGRGGTDLKREREREGVGH